MSLPMSAPNPSFFKPLLGVPHDRPGLPFGSNPATHPFRIAVVDDFNAQDPRAHGRLVSGILTRQLPQATIVPFHVERKKSPSGSYLDIPTALRQVAQSLSQGDRFDAVNLSMGDNISAPELTERFGETLPETGKTPEQKESWRTKLMGKLRDFVARSKVSQNPSARISSLENNSGENIVAGIDAISTITQTHRVPVFVAAGNSGPGMLNFYLLGKDVQGVGGLAPQEALKWRESGDNAFVNQWAPSEATASIQGESVPVGPGTSFATPQALARGLVTGLAK